MGRYGPAIVATMFLITAPSIDVRAQNGQIARHRRLLQTADEYEVIVTGRVQQVHAPRLFTMTKDGTDREWLVFVPDAEATPLEGTRVSARGVLRRIGSEDVLNRDTHAIRQVAIDSECSNDIDQAASDDQVASRQVLLAVSVITSSGRQLVRRTVPWRVAGMAASQDQGRSASSSGELPIAMPPAMLADHVESLAGHSVRVPNARVVGVYDPHVFLIESQTMLRPLLGFRDRVLVFIEGGTLRVTPDMLVASSVTVSGVARTLLGMQVSREVPWPAALTRDVVERLEIRAAVLATSVRTAEGVDLTVRSSTASTTAASPPSDR